MSCALIVQLAGAAPVALLSNWKNLKSMLWTVDLGKIACLGFSLFLAVNRIWKFLEQYKYI